MRIAIIQSEIHWESPSKNREMFDETISMIEGEVELIVLPEMFTTGFSMAPERLAETWPGSSVRWMQRVATSKKVALAGSLVVKDSGQYFNRLVFVYPDGHTEHYDKRHLFRMAGEHEQYSMGNERVIVKYKEWRIMLQICYDLRFPVWCRCRNDYDAMLLVANFPESRSLAWDSLLLARAIENQCYVIACNRVGVDGNGISYSGDSQVIDPTGKIDALATPGAKQVLLSTLSMEHLASTRENFPAYLDADNFMIIGT